MDAAFFRMAEADWDLLARLDLREVEGTFSAFNEFQTGRSSMAGLDSRLSAADFDEDGNPVSTPSYNVYGDYILYRPNAEDDTPIYGLAVPYTAQAYPVTQYLAPFNQVCARFAERGVTVLLTWSPRNAQAISEESTPEKRAELESCFRQNTTAPWITALEDSLLPGRWFYGTDNHLSTAGVAMRTEQIITALRPYLEAE